MRSVFLLGFLLVVLSVTLVFRSAEAEKTPSQKSIERRQRAEWMSFFLKDPKDAKMPTATLAVEAFNRAVQNYEDGDLDLAKVALEESIQHDGGNAFAYEFMGDIENQEQQLKAARENYQLAYNLDPSKRLKEKIEKLATQTKVEKNLSTYRDQHFLIKYQKDQSDYEGYELRQLLRKIYKQVSKDFAYYFKSQVVVLLYEPEDFKKVTNMAHWVTGVYDGKVRMPLDFQGYTEKSFEALATHEVTHAFVAGMSGRRAPAWINEGLAEYEENKVRKVDLTIFRSALATNSLFSLDQLMLGQPTTLQDTTSIQLFYQQSYKLVDYLVGRYKMFRLKKLLEEFKSGNNSDGAVRSVFKISIKHLETEWLKSLKK